MTTADTMLDDAMTKLEALTRIDERRLCVRAVRAEATDYRARAAFVRTEMKGVETEKEAELQAIASALYKVAGVIEGMTR